MSKFIRRDDNNLDRLFRRRLHDAEEPAPMHLWEGIRQRSEKKRRFMGWWLGGVVLLAGAIIWASLEHGSQNQSEELSLIPGGQKPQQSVVLESDLINNHQDLMIQDAQNIGLATTESEIRNTDFRSKNQESGTNQKRRKTVKINSINAQFADSGISADLNELSAPSFNNNTTTPIVEEPANTEIASTIATESDIETSMQLDSAASVQNEEPVVESNSSGNSPEPERISRFAFSLGCYGIYGKPSGENEPTLMNNQLSNSSSNGFYHQPYNYSTGFGLFGKIQNNRGWNLSLLAENQKTVSEVQYTTINNNYDITGTEDSIPGNQIIPTDPAYSFDTVSSTARYRLMNYSILFGKEITLGRFVMGLQTGPVLRFNRVLTNIPNSYYPDQLTLCPTGRRIDWQVSAQLGIRLSPSINLFTQFQYRRMLPVGNTTDNRLIHPAGGLGLSYTFR